MEDGIAVEDDEAMSTTSQTSVDTRSGDGKLFIEFTWFGKELFYSDISRVLILLLFTYRFS